MARTTTYRWSHGAKAVSHARHGHCSDSTDLGQAISRDDIAHDHAQETMGFVTDTSSSCEGESQLASNQLLGFAEDDRVDHVGDKVL